MRIHSIILAFLFLLLAQSISAQKVGVVLSGGGASGAAHIGVLKALEENNIPIDYITGTSIGALVGALYASGMSPIEIETLFKSDLFIKWANGEMVSKYQAFYKKGDASPKLLTINFDLDSLFETNLPTNFISSVPIDFGLLKMFAPASAAANYNFDSLMIPFRCIAADITNGKEYIFNQGNLATAVRASMAYPFYLSPINYKNRLLFDGGLYNNFPSDVMYNDFMPDYIIGSNVSRNDDPPTEDNLLSQIKSMLSRESNYSIECTKGIIIEPKVDGIELLSFEKNNNAIQAGYNAAILSIDSILPYVKRTISDTAIIDKRKAFAKSKTPLKFKEVKFNGLNEKQTQFIFKKALKKNDFFEYSILESAYMRLVSDRGISSVYPISTFNKNSSLFDLELIVKKEKNFQIEFGGIISSRPINTGYVALGYNRIKKTNLKLDANLYFGKLHSSAKFKTRIEFPAQNPIYTEASIINTKWDYFNSSKTLLEDIKPSYLIKNELFIEALVGMPIKYKGKLELGSEIFDLQNEYYQTNNFSRFDTADINRFRGYSPFLRYIRSTLNRDQYATKGSYLKLQTRYSFGDEKNTPGSTAAIKDETKNKREWIEFKIKYENYFLKKSKFNFGTLVEVIATNQPFFSNYTATVLMAPAFQPLPEMTTLFQYQYRTHSYVGFGLKTVYSIFDKLDFRLEGYIFQPYQEILDLNKDAAYGPEFSTRDFIGTATMVYETPIGPLAASFNYYDKADKQYKFLIHFGYILFNKKVLD